MAEYIDREAVLRAFRDHEPTNWTDSDVEIQEVFDYSLYRGLVAIAPAADVVERSLFDELKSYIERVEIKGYSVDAQHGIDYTLEQVLYLVEKFIEYRVGGNCNNCNNHSNERKGGEQE